MRLFTKSKKVQVSLDPSLAKHITSVEVYIAITQASLNSADDICRGWIENTTDDQKLYANLHYRVVSEFFYFFSHYMDRLAFASLCEGSRDALVDVIDELGFYPLIRTLFPDAGEEWRLKVVAQQMTNFNLAQEEYGVCKTLLPEDTTEGLHDLYLDSPETVVSRLYHHIAETLNQDHPMLYLELFKTVMTQLSTIEMEEKVKEAGKYLP